MKLFSLRSWLFSLLFKLFPKMINKAIIYEILFLHSVCDTLAYWLYSLTQGGVWFTVSSFFLVPRLFFNILFVESFKSSEGWLEGGWLLESASRSTCQWYWYCIKKNSPESCGFTVGWSGCNILEALLCVANSQESWCFHVHLRLISM